MFLKDDVVYHKTAFSFAMYKVVQDQRPGSNFVKVVCIKGKSTGWTTFTLAGNLNLYGVATNKQALRFLRR